MSQQFFITGTDTAVGKTYNVVGLLKLFKQKNLRAIGVKPIASGCDQINNEWVNADVELHREHSYVQLPHSQINPFAFAPRVAPHIAAELINEEMSVPKLIHKTRDILQYSADVHLIEGVGGWNCPINRKQTMADYVKAMQFKTILVVGVRLGCLNHALLTHNAILKEDVPLVGWIANYVDPDMLHRNENIATLKEMLSVPCLGVVDYLGSPEKSLNLDCLL